MTLPAQSNVMLDKICRRCAETAVAIIVCVGVNFTTGCITPSHSQRPPRIETPQPESIGVATMDADGTIILRLRAVDGDIRGEALFRYPKDHVEYAAVLKHIGGLRPGEVKPVPPWPDRDDHRSSARDP